MTRAAIYCRVSTAKQEDNTSLPTQLAGCRAKANENGWHIVAQFEEVDSGTALYRKEWSRLIELIRSGSIDVVLAYDQDRLTRDQNQVEYLVHELDKVGGRIELVHGDFDNSPMGRCIRSMVAFAKELERLSIIRTLRRTCSISVVTFSESGAPRFFACGLRMTLAPYRCIQGDPGHM
jgi:site-specific DNA recombinase